MMFSIFIKFQGLNIIKPVEKYDITEFYFVLQQLSGSFVSMILVNDIIIDNS